MKLRKLLVFMMAVVMCVASMSTLVAATPIGFIDTTLSISSLNLDVDTEYMANKDAVTRALQLSSDEADLIPNSQMTSVAIDGSAVYRNGVITLDGTASATVLGSAHRFARNRQYNVTSVSMSININNTNYPAVYDSQTKRITCNYTISSTQTEITAKVANFTINAVNAAGQEAVFSYTSNDSNTTCTITIGDELAYTFTRPGILTIDGEATATVGSERVSADITNTDGYGKMTISYNVSVTPVDPQGSTGDFVDRLYQVAMGRNADGAGKAYWIDRITNGVTGGDVAMHFLFSPEFLNKGTSDSEFVDTLYFVFFDRSGDRGGIDYWLTKLSNGVSRASVIASFINSPEFANICLSYGINSGSPTEPTIVMNPTSGVIGFVERLYINCLGRSTIDQSGANYWSNRLANRQNTGSEVARKFFNSQEFLSFNTSNTDYLTRLYNTVMGRTPDAGGFNYYLSRLDDGRMTRTQVLDSFLDSREWNDICITYSILK